MKKVLSQNFFNQPTLKFAKELLGKFLIHKIGRRLISGMITEVEAYVGPKDKASHASRGKIPRPPLAAGIPAEGLGTKRTEVMFGDPGRWYVYLIYGMYYCLNIVTEKREFPAAVLIRSVCLNQANTKLSHGICGNYVKGPGRVCRYFKIDTSFNAKLVNKKTGLWIEDRGVKAGPRLIKRGKRIGVDYAGKWKNKLWRFYLKNLSQK